MNKTLSAILIVIAVLALAGGVFFAGSMYARANAFGPSMMFAPGAGVGGYGMMGGGRGGFGMMGGYGWNNGTSSNVAPLTVDQAKAAAGKYIQSLNLQGLEIGEVMIFNNNAYVAIKESGTGLGAFELLVDPASQIAYPEYGPNMMWNLKYGGLNHGNMTLAPGASAGVGGRGGYGMMGGNGGMMGGWNYQTSPSANVAPTMTVASDQAIKYAQAYLDSNFAGAIAATDPIQFYGYYTLDFSKDGKIIGMLSVNGYNGQVFLHTWHGTFIEEAK